MSIITEQFCKACSEYLMFDLVANDWFSTSRGIDYDETGSTGYDCRASVEAGYGPHVI